MATDQLAEFVDSWIFLSVDFAALVIQAVGGGIASGSEPGLGGHIMLAGIIIQLGEHNLCHLSSLVNSTNSYFDSCHHRLLHHRR